MKYRASTTTMSYQQKLEADRQQIALRRKQYEEEWKQYEEQRKQSEEQRKQCEELLPIRHQESATQTSPPEQAQDLHATEEKAAERKRDDEVNRSFPLAVVGALIMFVGITALVTLPFANPEFRKPQFTSQAQTTARLVVEQMREEFVMQERSEDNNGSGRHVPASSRSTQTDSIDDGRLEELKERLDRIESLVMQLPGKIVAAEKPKKQPSLPEVNLAVLGVAGILAVAAYMCKAEDTRKRHRKAEERRQLVETMAERLAAVFKVDPRPLGTEKKSCSEDEDDASFENVQLPAN